mmetsp:Transcript_11836/g.39504  ORF Transcript_11836/g.39504 Transcript_11836/m.39504 type:complete len:455 (+) Transcript_11836:650-2014(+)
MASWIDPASRDANPSRARTASSTTRPRLRASTTSVSTFAGATPLANLEAVEDRSTCLLSSSFIRAFASGTTLFAGAASLPARAPRNKALFVCSSFRRRFFSWFKAKAFSAAVGSSANAFATTSRVPATTLRTSSTAFHRKTSFKATLYFRETLARESPASKTWNLSRGPFFAPAAQGHCRSVESTPALKMRPVSNCTQATRPAWPRKDCKIRPDVTSVTTTSESSPALTMRVASNCTSSTGPRCACVRCVTAPVASHHTTTEPSAKPPSTSSAPYLTAVSAGPPASKGVLEIIGSFLSASRAPSRAVSCSRACDGSASFGKAQTRTVDSAPPVTTQFGPTWRQDTVRRWPWSTRSLSPVERDHRIVLQSAPPVTTFSASQATAETVDSWPSTKRSTGKPAAPSFSRSVGASPSRFELDLNLAPIKFRAASAFSETSQAKVRASLPPLKMHSPAK